MSKIFKMFFVIILFFCIFSSSFANLNNINIISREDWGADENYRYLDSPEWVDILKKWENVSKYNLSDYQKKKAKIEAFKVRKANNFILKNYKEIIGINRIVKEENGHKLAWPIAYSKSKISIVIHHTDSNINEGDDNYNMIRKIYKYHALTRGWGDIGYNYLIGTNGKIFEGRAGGDFVVGAHDKWNNQASIGIALIGNYSNKKAPKKQLESLEKLINFLVKKYNIDLNKKQAFFSWCVGISEKCQNKPLVIQYDYSIIGHRDAGHTACPGDKLYFQLQDIKKKIGIGKNDKTNDKIDFIKKKILNLEEEKLLNILLKIELSIDKIGTNYQNLNKLIILQEIKNYILNLEKNKFYLKNNINDKVSFDKNNKIKVKLSYPLVDRISFKVSKNNKIKLREEKNHLILDVLSGENKRDLELDFEFTNNKLFIKNREIVDFDKVEYFRIHNLNSFGVIEISSWDRKPIWDSSGNLNDNKFRGDIVLYSKNNKLIVVNELYLNDYLKGLGEVSNSTNPEKIKTIIILARTYARWYMTKARKFAGEWFDASDDPNVFQKYLGFGLEQRSLKVNEIVEETKDLVVTFDGDLIKPWYSSSTDGKTISFTKYCENAKGVPDCAHPEKFPFLVGVTDPGGTKKAGHGVGVSGTGVQYFSERGWTFEMIIKYFLKGTEIEKKSN